MNRFLFFIATLSLSMQIQAGFCDELRRVAELMEARLLVGPNDKLNPDQDLTYYGKSPREVLNVFFEARQKSSAQNQYDDMQLGGLGKIEMDWMKIRIQDKVPFLPERSARRILLETLLQFEPEITKNNYPYGPYLRFGMAFAFAFAQNPRYDDGLTNASARKMLGEFINGDIRTRSENLSHIDQALSSEVLAAMHAPYFFLLHHGDIPMGKFNRFRDTPIRFVGLSDTDMKFDTTLNSSLSYLRHDFNHARIQTTPSLEESREELLDKLTLSERFFEKLQAKLKGQKESLRRSVEYLLFTATHEFLDILTVAETEDNSNLTVHHIEGANIVGGYIRFTMAEELSLKLYEKTREVIKSTWSSLKNETSPAASLPNP